MGSAPIGGLTYGAYGFGEVPIEFDVQTPYEADWRPNQEREAIWGIEEDDEE